MNQREAKRLGKQRGYGVVTWMDVPEIGKTYWTDSDGKVAVDEDNIWDVMESMCFDAESNGRQYSPWEHTAHEINESRYPDELWAAYEEGIALGIQQGVRKARKAYQQHPSDCASYRGMMRSGVPGQPVTILVGQHKGKTGTIVKWDAQATRNTRTTYGDPMTGKQRVAWTHYYVVSIDGKEALYKETELKA